MFYEDSNIKVDNTRYIIGNKTIPISSISSVQPTKKTHAPVGSTRTTKEVYTIPGSSKGFWYTAAYVAIVIILFITALGSNFSFSARHILPLIIGPFIVKYWMYSKYPSKDEYIKAVTETTYEDVPDDYHVTITTASGESSTHQSTDEEEILAIVEAINQAIVQRG